MISIQKHQNKLWFAVNAMFTVCGTALAIVMTTKSMGEILIAVDRDTELAVRWIFAAALFSSVALSVVAYKYQFIKKTSEELLSNPLVFRIIYLIFGMLCAGCLIGKFYDAAYVHNEITRLNVEYLRNMPNWWYHLPYVYKKVSEPSAVVPRRWLLSAAMFYPVTVFYTYFTMKFTGVLKRLVGSLSKEELRVLIAGSVAVVIYTVVLCNLSNVFYAPVLDGTKNVIGEEVFWTADNGRYLPQSIFVDVPHRQNSLAHMLFAVFSLPFGLIARMVSTKYLYQGTVLIALQMVLLVVASLMMSRLLVISGKKQAVFVIFSTLTFPMLIYSLAIEHSVLACVWLVFAIYECLNGGGAALWANGAVGALLTNGPAFLTAIKSKKSAVRDLFLCGFTFLIFACESGKIAIIINIGHTLKAVSGFAGKESAFPVKLMHFLTFVQSCVFAPESGYKYFASRHSWQMSPITTVNTVGVIVLLAVIVGFVMNHRKRFAQICLCWVLLSFYVVGITGWGIPENGTAIYTLYYSWAYVSLIYMAIDKLLTEKAKFAALVLLAALCLVFNGKALFDFMRFALQYYPVR
jgi:hypothetical protein